MSRSAIVFGEQLARPLKRRRWPELAGRRRRCWCWRRCARDLEQHAAHDESLQRVDTDNWRHRPWRVCTRARRPWPQSDARVAVALFDLLDDNKDGELQFADSTRSCGDENRRCQGEARARSARRRGRRPGALEEALDGAAGLVYSSNRELAKNLRRTMDLFRAWDTDGSGEIDKAEFDAPYASCCPRCAPTSRTPSLTSSMPTKVGRWSLSSCTHSSGRRRDAAAGGHGRARRAR